MIYVVIAVFVVGFGVFVAKRRAQQVGIVPPQVVTGPVQRLREGGSARKGEQL